MNKGIYQKMQFKRALKLYPTILLITVIMIAATVISAFAMIQINKNKSDNQLIKVGVVGDVEQSYLGIGLYAIKNMDTSRFYIELIEMSKEDAVRKLDRGEISGYVDIPENFVESVMYGNNKPLQYVRNDEPAGFSNALEREIVMMVSDIVTESQRAVYSTIDMARDQGATKDMWDKIDELNISYITHVLNRKDTREVILTGIKDDLTYGGYYICAIISFLLMVWGISCNSLLSERNYEFFKIMSSRGLGANSQIWAKLISFFAVTVMTAILFALAVGIVCTFADVGIPELLGTDIFTSLVFVIKILPSILMFATMHIMLYEVFRNSVGGILAQFIIAIGLGYISGIFYPNTFFPEAVQKFAAFMPAGAGFSYIRRTMAGVGVMKDMALVLGYGAVFYMISVVIRIYKIKGDKRI